MEAYKIGDLISYFSAFLFSEEREDCLSPSAFQFLLSFKRRSWE